MRTYFVHIVIFCFYISLCQSRHSTYLKQNKDLNPESRFRLPNNLQPLSYKLDLKPLFEPNFSFRGKIEIEFRCDEPTDKIVLHINHLSIKENSLKLSRKDKIREIIKIQKYYEVSKNDFLVIQLDSTLVKEKIYGLNITFNGNITEGSTGFFRRSYDDSKTGTKRWLIGTHLEETHAREVFPCFDEPALKAVFELCITRPDNMVALSNMDIIQSIPSKHGKTVTDHFKPSPPMSTYVFSFIVMDFEFRETTTRKGLRVRQWARDDILGKLNIDLATTDINYFEAFLDVDLPLDKIDIVYIPELEGLSNLGLIFLQEEVGFYTEQTTFEKKEHTIFMMGHVLGHQYFSNLVTLKWWDNVWLNEGFAEFMAYLAANLSDTNRPMFDQFNEQIYAYILERESFENNYLINPKVETTDDFKYIKTYSPYSKGYYLLRMMRFILGDDAFKMGLKNYIETYKYKNADQDEFLNILGLASESQGKNIDFPNIMSTWLHQMGYPVITIKRNYDEQITEITQQQFLYNNREYLTQQENLYTWEVPVTFITDGQSQLDSSKIIWLHQKNETIDKLLADEDKWIIGNNQLFGYYRVNYDVENWQMLIKQLKTDNKKIPEMQRAQILVDSFALARAGILDYEIPLDAFEYLSKENEYLPWDGAIASIQHLLLMLASIQQEKLLQRFILNQLLPTYNLVGWPEDLENKSFKDQIFRAFVIEQACFLEHKDCISHAQKEFKNWMANPESTRISPDLKAVILCNGIRFGSSRDWEFVWKQHLKAEYNEREMMLNALACSKDQNILNKYLQKTLASAKYKYGNDIIEFVSKYSKGYKLVWELFKMNGSLLIERYENLKPALVQVTSYFSTEQQLQELQQFFEDHKNKLDTVDPAIKQIIERVKGNVYWMNTNKHVILDLLKNKRHKS